MATVWAVEQWGSHPDEDNDDCWTGEDFESLEAAQVAYAEPVADRDARFITLGKYAGERHSRTFELLAIRENPKARKRASRAEADREWQREQARETGMLHGVGAYNEAMGYDDAHGVDCRCVSCAVANRNHGDL